MAARASISCRCPVSLVMYGWSFDLQCGKKCRTE